MTDPMPRKDVELLPRMPEAGIIAALHAELAQARADAKAAVAVAIERAAEAITSLWKWDDDGWLVERPDRKQAEAVLCALAPEDAIAEVAKLRAERDAMFRRATLAEEWRDHDKGRADKAEAQLAAANAREARKTFPILKGERASIDYQLVADHAEQARANHYQSVERLAERGGLSWCELYAVLHNRRWEKIDTNDAMIACRALEARYLAALAQPSTEGDK